MFDQMSMPLAFALIFGALIFAVVGAMVLTRVLGDRERRDDR